MVVLELELMPPTDVANNCVEWCLFSDIEKFIDIVIVCTIKFRYAPFFIIFVGVAL